MAERVAYLIVSDGPDEGRRLAIPENGAIIGRTRRCDIRLNDPGLSRRHCRFFFKEGKLWVADLDSSNGTVLDGNSVKEAWVKGGDRGSASRG